MEQQALRIWKLFISQPSLWDGWDLSSTPVGFHNESMAVLFGHPEPPSEFSAREAEGVRYHVALPKPVSFTANKSIELDNRVYKHAKFAVFPSLYKAQSSTLLEFLALGVDIVYSDLPENTAITQGIGLQFESGNPSSLAESLAKALSGKCPNNAESHLQILQRHNWDEITKRYVESYEEAISLALQCS